MERYVPIAILSEIALILSFSVDPPKEFILSLEGTMRSHVNLISDKVWDQLEPLFVQLSNFFGFWGLIRKEVNS